MLHLSVGDVHAVADHVEMTGNHLLQSLYIRQGEQREQIQSPLLGEDYGANYLPDLPIVEFW